MVNTAHCEKAKVLCIKDDLPLGKVSREIYFLRHAELREYFDDRLREYKYASPETRKDLDCLFREFLCVTDIAFDLLLDTIGKIVVNDIKSNELRGLHEEFAFAYKLATGGMRTKLCRLMHKVFDENKDAFRIVFHINEYCGTFNLEMLIATWYRNNFYLVGKKFKDELEDYKNLVASKCGK